MDRVLMYLTWYLYAERLAAMERSGWHLDNWLDEVYAPDGKRWQDLGL